MDTFRNFEEIEAWRQASEAKRQRLPAGRSLTAYRVAAYD